MDSCIHRALFISVVAAAFACASPKAETAPRVEQARAPAEAPSEPRRLGDDEVTPALARKAEQLLEAHHDDPIGTEVRFHVGGRKYLARVEQHYHPEGGPQKPWGPHKGISLFALEPLSERVSASR